jgi:hypothetical protein
MASYFDPTLREALMSKLLSAIFVHLLSLGAVLRLYLSLPQSNQEQPLLISGLVATCTILVVAIVRDLGIYWKSAPTRIRLFKKRRIRSYMCRWLSAGGRAVIFTRDMSWVDTPKVKNVLIEKSRKNELIICVDHIIPLVEELRLEGAEIIQYGMLGVVPRSRYTIIDFEKDNARVAVGGSVGNYHVIQEFRNGEHPFFGVADDLVRFLNAYTRQANAAGN